jgi:hypothetical protein
MTPMNRDVFSEYEKVCLRISGAVIIVFLIILSLTSKDIDDPRERLIIRDLYEEYIDLCDALSVQPSLDDERFAEMLKARNPHERTYSQLAEAIVAVGSKMPNKTKFSITDEVKESIYTIRGAVEYVAEVNGQGYSERVGDSEEKDRTRTEEDNNILNKGFDSARILQLVVEDLRNSAGSEPQNLQKREKDMEELCALTANNLTDEDEKLLSGIHGEGWASAFRQATLAERINVAASRILMLTYAREGEEVYEAYFRYRRDMGEDLAPSQIFARGQQFAQAYQNSKTRWQEAEESENGSRMTRKLVIGLLVIFIVIMMRYA